MNSTDAFAEAIARLLMLIVSIPFQIKEWKWPSQSKPEDFQPIGRPVFEDGCFFLKFPCKKYQRHRSRMVIEFWKETSYIDHGEEFVFVDSMHDFSPWSFLTIKFRPQHNTPKVVCNFYSNNMCFNTEVNQYSLTQIIQLEEYISGNSSLGLEEKEEYIDAIRSMRDGKKPPVSVMNKLWDFVIKNKDLLGTVADITGIIGFILGFIK